MLVSLEWFGFLGSLKMKANATSRAFFSPGGGYGWWFIVDLFQPISSGWSSMNSPYGMGLLMTLSQLHGTKWSQKEREKSTPWRIIPVRQVVI